MLAHWFACLQMEALEATLAVEMVEDVEKLTIPVNPVERASEPRLRHHLVLPNQIMRCACTFQLIVKKTRVVIMYIVLTLGRRPRSGNMFIFGH